MNAYATMFNDLLNQMTIVYSNCPRCKNRVDGLEEMAFLKEIGMCLQCDHVLADEAHLLSDK